jgi:hypothetical protein
MKRTMTGKVNGTPVKVTPQPKVSVSDGKGGSKSTGGVKVSEKK